MAYTEEVNKMIREYLKTNLDIHLECDPKPDNTMDITVQLLLEGEVIGERTHSIYYSITNNKYD